MMGLAVTGLTQVLMVLSCSAGSCTLFCSDARKRARLARTGSSHNLDSTATVMYSSSTTLSNQRNVVCCVAECCGACCLFVLNRRPVQPRQLPGRRAQLARATQRSAVAAEQAAPR
jgi:hypothetical protein